MQRLPIVATATPASMGALSSTHPSELNALVGGLWVVFCGYSSVPSGRGLLPPSRYSWVGKSRGGWKPNLVETTPGRVRRRRCRDRAARTETAVCVQNKHLHRWPGVETGVRSQEQTAWATRGHKWQKQRLASDSFDLSTSGLWAQRAGVSCTTAL